MPMNDDLYLYYELAGWTRPEGCHGCEFTRRSCIIWKDCPVHGIDSTDPTMNLPPMHVAAEDQ